MKREGLMTEGGEIKSKIVCMNVDSRFFDYSYEYCWYVLTDAIVQFKNIAGYKSCDIGSYKIHFYLLMLLSLCISPITLRKRSEQMWDPASLSRWAKKESHNALFQWHTHFSTWHAVFEGNCMLEDKTLHQAFLLSLIWIRSFELSGQAPLDNQWCAFKKATVSEKVILIDVMRKFSGRLI